MALIAADAIGTNGGAPDRERLHRHEPQVRRLSDESLVDTLEAPARSRRFEAAAELYTRATAQPGGHIALLLERTLASADRQARARACELLAAIPGLERPEPLVRALADACADVRALAAHALGRHRVATPAAVIALLGAGADPDPTVQVTALAALAVIVPSTAVVRALGLALVSDRYSVAGAAIRTLRSATIGTLEAARVLLESRASLEKRAGLAVIHSTSQPADVTAARTTLLTLPGVDTYVRRAATRVLGHLAEPTSQQVSRLTLLTADWDPTLRATAAVSLGQLATRNDAALAPYIAAIRRFGDSEFVDLASALRAAGDPAPVTAPLLERLALARGFAQIDLADAIAAPRRARAAIRGLAIGGVVLPLDDRRIDEAIESANASDRPRIASQFLAFTRHEEAAIRASSAVFAAYLDYGVATAIALQGLADSDADANVRAVAKSLLERVRHQND